MRNVDRENLCWRLKVWIDDETEYTVLNALNRDGNYPVVRGDFVLITHLDIPYREVRYRAPQYRIAAKRWRADLSQPRACRLSPPPRLDEWVRSSIFDYDEFIRSGSPESEAYAPAGRDQVPSPFAP